MKNIIRIVLTIHFMFVFVHATCQVPDAEMQERKNALNEFAKRKTPLIILNDKIILSLDEYLSYHDDFIDYSKIKSKEYAKERYGKKGKNGILKVFTKAYVDSVYSPRRDYIVKTFRMKEMNCFFGSSNPLILFGEKEISKQEYYDMPEDTVAFVNFYVTDFVKNFYGAKAKNGIVYMCPRKERSNIDRYSLPLPMGDRNYLYDDYRYIVFKEYEPFPNSYITNKIKEYQGRYDKADGAEVTVSCIIQADGTISPLFIENIEAKKQLTEEEQALYINIATEIINNMPKWSDTTIFMYDRNQDVYVGEKRESSVSLHFKF